MQKAWIVRPFPHNIDRLAIFREKGFIAIGWPSIGNLTNCNKLDLKQKLTGEPYHLESLALGNALATVDMFVNQMNTGDYILIPYGSDIYIGEINSEYYWCNSVDNQQDGYPHQRLVKWMNNCLRKDLSIELRTSLKAHRTVVNISQHLEEITALASGNYQYQTRQPKKFLDIIYPLRPDFTVTFQLPSNTTKDEAQRLSTYIATLYFEQRSNNQLWEY